ncbi:MAG TPA: MFS transporter [Candidatus Omnitrophota bacterium]|nr:MFS transporter [Candidatus Omnitrophota bacterium]
MIRFETSEKRFVYVLLCLASFTISFNLAAITAAIPVISSDLNLPDFLVAKIIPYYYIPYGLAALIYAPLTRFFSYRSVLTVSMVFYAGACYFCATVAELNFFFLGRIAMGITAAGVIPLGLMVIGEFYEKNIRGRLIGIFFGCTFVASLLGVILGGFADWRWLFTAPAILGGLLSLLVSLCPSSILRQKHLGHINYFQSLGNSSILRVFLFIFAISFLYHGVHAWYGVYLNRVYHLDKLAISIFFIITLIGGFVGQLLGGVISDLKGRKAACYMGVIGLGLSTIFLYTTYPLFALAIILFSIPMCWTIGHNGLSTVLTDFPDEDRPIIASLNSAVRFFSGGLGFQVSSLFVEQSFRLTFLGIGILILLLSFILKYIIPNN